MAANTRSYPSTGASRIIQEADGYDAGLCSEKRNLNKASGRLRGPVFLYVMQDNYRTLMIKKTEPGLVTDIRATRLPVVQRGLSAAPVSVNAAAVS